MTNHIPMIHAAERAQQTIRFFAGQEGGDPEDHPRRG